MSRASLQRRLFAGALVWIVVALVVTGLALSLLFREHIEREMGRRLEADFLQLVSHLSVTADGRLSAVRPLSDPLYERALSGRYWQISGPDGQPLLRSRSLWQQRLSADPSVGDGAQRITGVRDAPLLAVARTITLPRYGSPLTITVAATLAPVDSAVAAFRRILVLALGLLAAGLIGAAALQVGLGLRPLRQLRAELSAMRSAGARRVSGDYPGEVAPLVDDLNTVLDDNDALIERARQQAANLAHALKTPLSVMANEADRLSRAGDSARADRLQGQVDAMRRQIDWHLARTRIAGARRSGVVTEVAPVIDGLTRTLQRLFGDAGRVIDTECAPDLLFAGEAQDLEQMMGNLMENACKWSRGIVEVRAVPGDGRLHIRVDDDGPGLTADQRRDAVQRGQRFDESTPGSGLGLAIVSDLASAYAGRLSLAPAALGGLSARLELPIQPRPGAGRGLMRSGG
ncbi:sensor histidine kinase [Salinisphaera sp. T31B1]|uniref:sensor histidine kinase n=1 Tax=Salinisphaera sp. T31B1 TaxID=727963 RepID=UPI00333FE035